MFALQIESSSYWLVRMMQYFLWFFGWPLVCAIANLAFIYICRCIFLIGLLIWFVVAFFVFRLVFGVFWCSLKIWAFFEGCVLLWAVRAWQLFNLLSPQSNHTCALVYIGVILFPLKKYFCFTSLLYIFYIYIYM